MRNKWPTSVPVSAAGTFPCLLVLVLAPPLPGLGFGSRKQQASSILPGCCYHWAVFTSRRTKIFLSGPWQFSPLYCRRSPGAVTCLENVNILFSTALNNGHLMRGTWHLTLPPPATRRPPPLDLEIRKLPLTFRVQGQGQGEGWGVRDARVTDTCQGSHIIITLYIQLFQSILFILPFDNVNCVWWSIYCHISIKRMKTKKMYIFALN